jgi:hypothetical protein
MKTERMLDMELLDLVRAVKRYLKLKHKPRRRKRRYAELDIVRGELPESPKVKRKPRR